MRPHEWLGTPHWVRVASGGNSALVGLGWMLGDQWHMVRRYAEAASYAVIAAIAGLLLWFVWRRLRQRRPA